MKINNQACSWTKGDPLLTKYHDTEWGVPLHADKKLFEFLILEGFQAGLSWLTILKRREGYKRLYEDFDPEKVATFDEARVEQMLQDAGIIRNRKKIESSINNAKRFLEVREEFGSFCNYLWGFTYQP